MERRGIGGSQIAAALGVHPYKAPIDLWRELVGDAPSFGGNARTHWGNRLEGVVRQEYADRHHIAVYVPPEPLYHDAEPWARASPDGIAIEPWNQYTDVAHPPRDAWRHGLEVKTADARTLERWGGAGTDEVPIEYMLQCQHYMWICDLARWDLAALLGGNDYREYPLRRDDDIVEMIREGGRRFWREHVETCTPPESDGSASYRRFLASRYPAVGDEFIEADDEMNATVSDLRATRATLREMEVRKERLEQRILEVVGDASGIETWQGRLTCRPRQGRRTTDWDAVRDELDHTARVQFDAARERLTKRGAPSRPVLVPRSWGRDTEEQS